jgi:hypothetical protein
MTPVQGCLDARTGYTVTRLLQQLAGGSSYAAQGRPAAGLVLQVPFL